MIRWSFFLRRLTLVAIVALVVWVVLDPLVRWLAIHSGEAITLARWDIDEAETSLWPCKLALSGVQVADPRAPMKNLFQADEIALAVDPAALAQRCLVVREGRVSGLRFNTDRTTPGEIDPLFRLQWAAPDLPQIEIDAQPAANTVEGWLTKLLPLLQQDAVQQFEQFESVRLAQQLMQRWPAEYTRLETRAAQLKTRIDQLQATSQSKPSDPVQQIQTSTKMVADVDTILHDLESFVHDLDQLKQQAVRDKDAVVAAQKTDAQRIRELFRSENLTPEGMTDYLLRRELGDRVLAMARWIGWARSHVPQQVKDAHPLRLRGMDIAFPKQRKYPEFLAESLAVDGEAALNDEQFRFAGMVNNLTSDPAMVGKPVAIRLQIDGPAKMRLEALVDQNGPQPHQRILIDCPAFPQPQRVLGRPDQLAVTVSPGNTYLWMLLDLAGDELSGQIQLRQQPIQIVPSLAPQLKSLGASLQAAADKIRSLEMVVDVSGTLAHPAWKTRCDLGPKLAAAIDTLIRHELESRCDQMVVALDRQLQANLGNFDQMLQTRYNAVMVKYNQHKDEARQLAQAVAQHIPGMANLPDALKNQPAAAQVFGLLPKSDANQAPAKTDAQQGPVPPISSLKLF